MSTVVLPRLSELFKDRNDEPESLVLPPLRNFPQSHAADRSRDASKYAHSDRPEGYRPFGSGCPSIVESEMHCSWYNRSFSNHNSCSRDSTPSDESLDQETDFERPQDLQSAQMILFNSAGQEDKSLSGNTKPKKVKYHFCEICQKPFPRPSGLRAHMNMHTKEKPFECGFPGCPKRFSVLSNAKRHLRTHGVGLSPSDDLSPLPYVVDFEEPMIVSMDSDYPQGRGPSKEPLNLRWMPLGAESRRSRKTQFFMDLY